MVECKICRNVFNSLKSLAQHLTRPKVKQSHNISRTKDYYDIFLLNERSNICHLDGCFNETNYINLRKGYLKYCCHNHSQTSDKIRKIRSENNKKSWKDPESGHNSKECRELMHKTAVENWKDPNYILRNPEVRKKRGEKISKLRKDPTSKYNTEEYKKKTKERLGVLSRDPETRIKMETNNMEKYGCKYPSQNKEIKNRIKESNIKTYNEKRGEIQEKTTQTNLKKFGYEHIMKDPNYVKENKSGENHPNWNPNIDHSALFEYTWEFYDRKMRKKILEDQNWIDPLSGEEFRIPHLHHINYDKKDNSRINLIFLDASSHGKTNSKSERDFWKNMLIDINTKIVEKSLNLYEGIDFKEI